MPSDFFTQLGKNVAAELGAPSGRSPADSATRARAGEILKQTLASHLTTPPKTAKDSAMPLADRAMKSGPRYGRDQLFEQTQEGPEYNQNDQAPLSGQDCLQLVQLCMNKLVGGDRDEFCEGLAQLLSTETGAQDDGMLQIRHYPNGHNPNDGNGNGNRGNGNNGNNNGLDRRSAKDQGLPKNNMGAIDQRRPSAKDRKAAQDSAIRGSVRVLNSSSFARRFPDAATVKFGGMGR
jgi:hypothetical protein